MTLKDEILEYVQSRDWVSFAELQRLNGFKAEKGLVVEHGTFDNVLLWVGVSEEACQALADLTKEGKIHWMPGHWLSYAADGQMLKLPLAKRARNYTKPHWLPVFYRPGARP